jgi:hypothetical protein
VFLEKLGMICGIMYDAQVLYLLLTFSASLNKLKESKIHDEGRKKIKN